MDTFSEEDIALAQELYARWDGGRGESKSQLEIDTWDDATSHGRHFDRFVGGILGVSTTKRSKQTDRIVELEAQIRGLGRGPVGAEAPEWEVQVQHARQACMQALQVWNDPLAPFRTGAFAMLFVAGWNSLAIACLMRSGGEWSEPCDDVDPDAVRSLDTWELMRRAFPGDDSRGLLANFGFWLDLRNCVAHRCLPALDTMVIPYAQAGLLNFETTVTDVFGDEFALAEAVSVPLQLAGFRDPGVLRSRKVLLASLPPDVQAMLARADEAEDDLLTDPTYTLRVAFIPAVPASGRNPDAVAYFVRPGEVPDELAEDIERYVVLAKPTRSAAKFLPSTVVEEVQRRTGMKFNFTHHSGAARALGAWPVDGPKTRTVNERYAEYNSAFKRYLYTQAWIDLLCSELADPQRFADVTGHPQQPLPAAAAAPGATTAPEA